MIKKSIEQYMSMVTEYGTFIPVSSKAVGKTIKEIEAFGVKVDNYYRSPSTFDIKLKPMPNIKLRVGMGIYVIGKRSKINDLRESLNLP